MNMATQTNDSVCLWDKVKVRMADGSIRELCVVQIDEADLQAGKISSESPVAQAILGAKAGEKKEYQVGDKKMVIEVLEIIKPNATP